MSAGVTPTRGPWAGLEWCDEQHDGFQQSPLWVCSFPRDNERLRLRCRGAADVSPSQSGVLGIELERVRCGCEP